VEEHCCGNDEKEQNKERKKNKKKDKKKKQKHRSLLVSSILEVTGATIKPHELNFNTSGWFSCFLGLFLSCSF
jgi:hypothetical protein